MIIYTKNDSTLNIPVGLGPNVGPLDASLVPLEVDSSTVAQHITPLGDGFSSVDVNPYTVESFTVDPSTMPQAIIPENADAISRVTVNAVDNTIDQNIQAGNIKEGVTILGVEGTFQGGTLQAKQTDSSTVIQTLTPDEGYFGLSSVVVLPYTTEHPTLDVSQNGLYTLIPQGADALSGAEINVNVQSTFNWIIEARKGNITDVSCYSLDGVGALNNGAKGILSNAPITTLPQLGSDNVGSYGLCRAFEGTAITRADISVNSDSYGCSEIFTHCHALRDASITLSGVGEARMSYGFAGDSMIRNIDISVNTYRWRDFSGLLGSNDAYDGSLNLRFLTNIDSNLGSGCFESICQYMGSQNWADTADINVYFKTGYSYPDIDSPEHTGVDQAFQYAFFGSSVRTAPAFLGRIGTIRGNYNFYYFMQWTKIQSLDLGVRLINGSNNFENAFAGIHTLTTLNLKGVFEQNTDGNNFYNTFFDCPNLKTVNTNALAGSFPFMYPQDNVNVICSAEYIENVNLYDVYSPVYLLWQPRLKEATVLDILTKAVGATFPQLSSSMPREISFYSGGLDVYDDAQGSIQAAYDAAVQDGWTINNLNILPPRDYIPVDYIESTGQTLTLGNTLGFYDAVLAEYNYSAFDGGTLIGVDAPGTANNFGFSSNGLYTVLHFGSSGTDQFWAAAVNPSVWYKGVAGVYVDNVGGFTWTDGNSYSTYPAYNTDDYSGTGNNLLRFGDASNYGKLKSLKVYTGLNWPANIHFNGADIEVTATQLYNYEPVQRILDGAYGLLETSTNVFYTASGITGGYLS